LLGQKCGFKNLRARRILVRGSEITGNERVQGKRGRRAIQVSIRYRVRRVRKCQPDQLSRAKLDPGSRFLPFFWGIFKRPRGRLREGGINLSSRRARPQHVGEGEERPGRPRHVATPQNAAARDSISHAANTQKEIKGQSQNLSSSWKKVRVQKS
jgi:hypothetical protein